MTTELKNPLMTDIECKRLYNRIIKKLQNDKFILNKKDEWVISKLNECEKSIGYMSMFNDLIRVYDDTQHTQEEEHHEEEEDYASGSE